MKPTLLLLILTAPLFACGGGGGATPTASPVVDPIPNPAKLTLEQPPSGSLPANLLPPG